MTQNNPCHADEPNAVHGSDACVFLPSVHELGEVQRKSKAEQKPSKYTYRETGRKSTVEYKIVKRT